MNTHRITWHTNLGPVHKECPTEEVLNFCQTIIGMGFAPEISLLDTDPET